MSANSRTRARAHARRGAARRATPRRRHPSARAHQRPSVIAKEFIAARWDLGGTLGQSDLGAVAQPFRDALLVNPYDLEAFATVLGDALRMPAHERRARMTRLRAAVEAESPGAWAQSFLDRLCATQTR